MTTTSSPSVGSAPIDLEQKLDDKLRNIELQKSEEQAQELARQLNLPYFNLRIFSISPATVAILDESASRAGQMAVILKSGSHLQIAVLNPDHPQTKEQLRLILDSGLTYELVIVSPHSLQLVWKQYEIEKRSQKTRLDRVAIKESEISAIQKEINNLASLQEKLSKMSTSEIMNVLIAGALGTSASDIHLEPEQGTVRLRYRIDGMLQDVLDISAKDYSQVLSRIKLLSGLKLNIHEIPQDGRFTIKQESVEIEIRTSVLPSAYGETVVMRLLDPRKIKQKLEELGLRTDTLDLIKTLLKKTTGAILTTGPTGSGKTTTLYAFINHINSPDIKVITIENPIEYHIEGISQTQVDPAAGYDFASGLRSIVRQDPDVILVGEIRDPDTADIAMQAALTGHLVFSTLHTNDAAGAIPRLIDLGVRSETIAPATNAAMAQRLVRRLCLSCRKKETIKEEDFVLLTNHLSALPKTIVIPSFAKNMEIFYPQKCKDCNFTGYNDRIGVYEIFAIDSEIEKMIITTPSITEIRNLAMSKGMITMLQDGLIKVLDGITSIEEVMRVIGE